MTQCHSAHQHQRPKRTDFLVGGMLLIYGQAPQMHVTPESPLSILFSTDLIKSSCDLTILQRSEQPTGAVLRS